MFSCEADDDTLLFACVLACMLALALLAAEARAGGATVFMGVSDLISMTTGAAAAATAAAGAGVLEVEVDLYVAIKD